MSDDVKYGRSFHGGGGVTLAGILVALIILGLLAAMFISPYFEMQAFNKFSKTKATYWDALWTELRIIPDGGDR